MMLLYTGLAYLGLSLPWLVVVGDSCQLRRLALYSWAVFMSRLAFISWSVLMSVEVLLTLTSRVVALIAAGAHLALDSWEVDTLSPSAVTSCIIVDLSTNWHIVLI